MIQEVGKPMKTSPENTNWFLHQLLMTGKDKAARFKANCNRYVLSYSIKDFTPSA